MFTTGSLPKRRTQFFKQGPAGDVPFCMFLLEDHIEPGWGTTSSFWSPKTAHEQGGPHPVPLRSSNSCLGTQPASCKTELRGGLGEGGGVGKSFVGIDVSQDCLEVYVRSSRELPTSQKGRLCWWEGWLLLVRSLWCWKRAVGWNAQRRDVAGGKDTDGGGEPSPNQGFRQSGWPRPMSWMRRYWHASPR